MTEQFPTGVAKTTRGARRQSHDDYRKPAVNRSVYRANVRLDWDRDGTACEVKKRLQTDFFGVNDRYSFTYCVGSGRAGAYLNVLWNDRREHTDPSKRPGWDADLQFDVDQLTQPDMGQVAIENRQETGSADPVDQLYFTINVLSSPTAGHFPLTFKYGVKDTAAGGGRGYIAKVTIDLDLTFC